jgi:hypothetical protein
MCDQIDLNNNFRIYQDPPIKVRNPDIIIIGKSLIYDLL